MIFKDLATVAPGIQIKILADRYSKDINNYVASTVNSFRLSSNFGKAKNFMIA